MVLEQLRAPTSFRWSRRSASASTTSYLQYQCRHLGRRHRRRARAKRLLFLTDVPGVLDKDGQLIGDMTVEQARALIADGTISGGMIPKVENLHRCGEHGRRGRRHHGRPQPHALLLEIFTDPGMGTLMHR